jgi:hypothetical protein
MAAPYLIVDDIDKRKIIVFKNGPSCPHFTIYSIIGIQVLAPFTFSSHFRRALNVELVEILEAKVDLEELAPSEPVRSNHAALRL